MSKKKIRAIVADVKQTLMPDQHTHSTMVQLIRLMEALEGYFK